MENPYSPPESGQRRVFKMSLVVPVSSIMVIVIWFGYAALYAMREGEAPLSGIVAISFEVFLLCEIGIIASLVINKYRLDKFLEKYPAIDNPMAIQEVKPIIRTNMYSALMTIVFLGIGTLTAIMTILNHGFIKMAVVGALSLLTSWMMKWYGPSEEKLKQISVTGEVLSREFEDLLESWLGKSLPDF